MDQKFGILRCGFRLPRNFARNPRPRRTIMVDRSDAGDQQEHDPLVSTHLVPICTPIIETMMIPEVGRYLPE